MKVMIMFRKFEATSADPDLGLIMCILTTLEFPKHNHDFHSLDLPLLFKSFVLGYLQLPAISNYFFINIAH